MENIQLKQAITYEETDPFKCEQCRGSVFVSGVRIGTIEPGHPKNPTKERLFLEFKIGYCKDCGHVRGEPARIIS